MTNVEGNRRTRAIYSKRVRPLHQMRDKHIVVIA